VPIVLKTGSLNLLEPRWPDQACIGIAFFLKEFCYVELVTRTSIFQRKERTGIFFQNSMRPTRGMKINLVKIFFSFYVKNIPPYTDTFLKNKYQIQGFVIHITWSVTLLDILFGICFMAPLRMQEMV
jgi:hypothetical protein